MTSPEGRGTSVTVEVAAPPEALWPLITDIELPARFSAEFQGARWIQGEGAALGAAFRGRNRNGFMGAWTTVSVVDVCEPPFRFGWAVGRPAAAHWRLETTPLDAGGSRLELSVRFGAGRSGLSAAVAAEPQRAEAIIAWRLADLRASMQATVDGFAALVTAR